MTAIDTSKLKEGMRVIYKFGGNSYSDILCKRCDQWGAKKHFHGLIWATGEGTGELLHNVTNLFFPDLQEQDRVEEMKWNDRVQCTNSDTWPDKPEEAFYGFPCPDGGHYIKTGSGFNTLYHYNQCRPIPKPDPDGELRKILLDYYIERHKIGILDINTTIQKIKSLLAAKVQNVSDKEIIEKADELYGQEESLKEDRAFREGAK